jgi:hypothetical protein
MVIAHVVGHGRDEGQVGWRDRERLLTLTLTRLFTNLSSRSRSAGVPSPGRYRME